MALFLYCSFALLEAIIKYKIHEITDLFWHNIFFCKVRFIMGVNGDFHENCYNSEKRVGKTSWFYFLLIVQIIRNGNKRKNTKNYWLTLPVKNIWVGGVNTHWYFKHENTLKLISRTPANVNATLKSIGLHLAFVIWCRT